MGRMSKRNKQKKEAWNMSKEAQTIKRQYVEPDTSDAPVHILTTGRKARGGGTRSLMCLDSIWLYYEIVHSKKEHIVNLNKLVSVL